MDESNATEEKAPDGTKTPMWRIGQLARFHKIKPVYALAKEVGGKSKKVTMSLTLDKQVYYGSANTKKQARQNAANNALKNTSLTFPEPKKKKANFNPKAFTATVRLNGWAMTHKKEVRYDVVEKNHRVQMTPYNRQQQQLLANPVVLQSQFDSPHDIYSFNLHPNSDSLAMGESENYERYPYFLHRPHFFNVCVVVGDKKFYGQGSTLQSARHRAAENALELLSLSDETDANQSASESDSSKSLVGTLRQELLPRNMSLTFNDVDESGPAHLRRYTVEAVAGHFSGPTLDETLPHFRETGSGMSKKAAKQEACSQVLEKIKELPPCIKKQPESEKPLVKPHHLSHVLHPVSRLLQICQAQKIKEPAYESDEKREESNFVVRCLLQDKIVTGTGKSKKEAKKSAANAMLLELGKQPGMLKSVPNKDMTPQKSIIKTRDSDKGNKRLQVKFNDPVA